VACLSGADPLLIPDQRIWDLCWTNWMYFSPGILVFHCQYHSNNAASETSVNSYQAYALLRCDITFVGSYAPTFRDSPSVPSLTVKPNIRNFANFYYVVISPKAPYSDVVTSLYLCLRGKALLRMWFSCKTSLPL
jgi:hypothetical protein